MRKRNQLVFDAVVSEAIPCVVFMGGGYSKPIGPTVEAFYDLFLDAARTNRQRLDETQQSTPKGNVESSRTRQGRL